MTKKDFEKYSKDEIVEVLIKYKTLFHPERILAELERFSRLKAWTKYEMLSKQAEIKRDEYIKYLKQLEAKYGTITLKKLTIEEIEKLSVLMKEVDTLSHQEDVAYEEYERLEKNIIK